MTSPDLIEELKDGQLWGRIRRMSEKDSTLKEMLEQVKVYYELKYGSEQRKRNEKAI